MTDLVASKIIAHANAGGLEVDLSCRRVLQELQELKDRSGSAAGQ